MSDYYNLCWSSGKAIERSLTKELEEVVIMAKIMSRANDNQNAQTIIIADDKANPVMFIHNGICFLRKITDET